jgi:TATA-binding protein-associated factor
VLPFLLRRLKEDVLQDLPPKIIQDYYCELSPLQAVLYDEFQKSRAAEEAGQEVQEGAGQGHVFQSLQYLRKLCNHPALVIDDKHAADIKRRANVNTDVRDVSNAPKLEALK